MITMSLNTTINLATSARVGTTAVNNSPGVDLSALTGKCAIVLNSSATEGSGMTSAVKLQHSDTDVNENYEDAGVAFTTVTNAAASFQTIEMDVDGFKKFVRVVTTLGGTNPYVTRSVTLLGKTA